MNDTYKFKFSDFESSITRKIVVLFLLKKDWERMLGMKKQLSDEEAHFADIDGKVYYEGAMTWDNYKQAQEVIDHESNC